MKRIGELRDTILRRVNSWNKPDRKTVINSEGDAMSALIQAESAELTDAEAVRLAQRGDAGAF